jgi:uncharacterized protein YndB with AHSA1/START domain
MTQIQLEIWIRAEPKVVFDAVTTKAGLDAWWGRAVSAEPAVGAVVEFDHGLGAPLRMRVVELVPDRRVVWRCVSDFADPVNPASEWLGTSITFALRPGAGDPAADWLRPRLGWDRDGAADDFTIVEFRHVDWPRESRWLPFCADGWGKALSGLALFCERGEAARREPV